MDEDETKRKDGHEVELRRIPLRSIVVERVRKINSTAQGHLRMSIKRLGVIEPLVVVPMQDHPGFYELVSGYRRYRAVLDLTWAERTMGSEDMDWTNEFLSDAKKYAAFNDPEAALAAAGATVPCVVHSGVDATWVREAARAENVVRQAFARADEDRLLAGEESPSWTWAADVDGRIGDNGLPWRTPPRSGMVAEPFDVLQGAVHRALEVGGPVETPFTECDECGASFEDVGYVVGVLTIGAGYSGEINDPPWLDRKDAKMKCPRCVQKECFEAYAPGNADESVWAR